MVYKEKQINLHNLESVHTRILTECLPSGLLSEPGVDLHDRSSANLSECNEHRFPNTHVISWNMNGVQNFNKLRTLQKMVGSCQPLFILIQESHSDSKCDLDLIKCQIDWISEEMDKTKAKPNQRSNQKCRFIQGNKQSKHLLKRENVRAVKRQLRCDHNKNKKEYKNSIFVEGNKNKIKSGRDKINIRKNRKRENNTRGKIQQRKGKEREKEQ